MRLCAGDHRCGATAGKTDIYGRLHRRLRPQEQQNNAEAKRTGCTGETPHIFFRYRHSPLSKAPRR